MDALRRQKKHSSSEPGIPWARPRPRFDIPEVREGSSEQTGGQEASPGEPTASSTGTAPSADASVDPTASAPVRGRTLAERPVYAGFMGTVGVGVALLCYWIAMNIGALGGWITGAMFIALGLDPVVRWVERKGLPRWSGVLGVVVVLAGVVTLLSTVIIPSIARQAVSFAQSFPSTLQNFLNSEFVQTLDERWGLRGRIEEESGKLVNQVVNDSNFVGGFLNGLVNAGSTIAQVVTGTLIVLFLALYFLSSLPTIKAWFVRLAPRSKRTRVGSLTEQITESVGNYVMGQAVVAILNASYALIVMLILGVPYAMLNAFLVVMLAFIPLIGGVAAGVLVTLIALLGGWQTALVYAICYFAYLQVEAYFISPRIMRKAVAVPAAVAVIAVAAGGALWGVLGAIIAIPVAASGLLLVREIFVPHQDRR